MTTTPAQNVSDQELLTLVRNVPDMLCIAGADGRFAWVSPRFAEHFGYTVEELRAIPFLDMVHPADQARAVAAVEDLTRGGYNFEVELRARDASGQYRWLQWNSAGIPGGSFYCCARDVTDRKDFETKLAERNQMLQMAEGLAGVGHWRLSLADQHLHWSPYVFTIHGLDPEDLQPSIDTAIQAYHPDDRDAVAAAVEAAVQDGQPFEFAARIVRPDGEVRHVKSVGVPEFGQDGQVEAVFGVFSDVTEERAMAEAVRRSERMASLGTMAAGIAHEINNPLGYTLGNLTLIRELLEQGHDGPSAEDLEDLREMLASCLDGADRIRKIVDGMRSFSHPGGEEATAVDVREVVDTACEMVLHEVRPRARLVRRLESVPPILGQRNPLTQVLVNLIVNAAQALPTGDAGNHIVEVGVTGDGGTVEITVRDTGPGIPEEIRNRVFDPFFTTKAVGQGTGLGLSIAHSIVTQHGGELTLLDAPEGGCLATVSLPAAPSPSHPARGGKPEQVGHDARPVVLVVDDEVQTLRLLRRALDRTFQVVALASGVEAVEYLAAGRPCDVVLCDLMMPEISGMEVHAFVQSERPDLRDHFIIGTGGAFTPEARAFLAESEVPVMGKPFDLNLLRETLLGHLEG